jgi:hypothetical protein
MVRGQTPRLAAERLDRFEVGVHGLGRQAQGLRDLRQPFAAHDLRQHAALGRRQPFPDLPATPDPIRRRLDLPQLQGGQLSEGGEVRPPAGEGHLDQAHAILRPRVHPLAVPRHLQEGARGIQVPHPVRVIQMHHRGEEEHQGEQASSPRQHDMEGTALRLLRLKDLHHLHPDHIGGVLIGDIRHGASEILQHDPTQADGAAGMGVEAVGELAIQAFQGVTGSGILGSEVQHHHLNDLLAAAQQGVQGKGDHLRLPTQRGDHRAGRSVFHGPPPADRISRDTEDPDGAVPRCADRRAAELW